MNTRYRKRPIEIDAVTWTGSNSKEVHDFLGDDFRGLRWSNERMAHLLLIRTLENPEHPFAAPPGWKVLRGVQGEHYACAPDIFAATYEDATTPAVDLTAWAEQLAVDNLQPDTEHALTFNAGPQPIARVHFAFHDGLSDEARTALVQGIGEACAGELAAAQEGTD